MHQAKKPNRKQLKTPIDTQKIKNPDIAAKFELDLKNRYMALNREKEIDMETQWEYFKSSVTESAEATIGRRRGTKKEQWISQRSWNLIDKRKELKQKRNLAKCTEERQRADRYYRDMDKEVKKSCKADKNTWLEQKCTEAEKASKRNDTKTLYRIVRELSGTEGNTRTKTIQIKDKNGNILTTEQAQNARWIEHFQAVLNQPEPVMALDLSKEQQQTPLPVNLSAITEEEVKYAIKQLKNNKAPGHDDITGEMLKKGGTTAALWMTELFNEIWEKQAVPEDWTKGTIIRIPKKGNLADCNNWRGITLLSIPGKVFSKVLLNRLSKDIDERLRNEQAGFRKERSCPEQIATLRNIIEQSLEFNTELHLNFLDFKKAFTSVHRDSLWKIVRLYGIPDQYIAIFKSLYAHSQCCIRTENGNTEYFDIISGVRQGCILSPLLFLIVIDYILKSCLSETKFGIEWNGTRLTDLDFADDIVLFAEKRDLLKQMTNSVQESAGKIGLLLNSDKTKIMEINTKSPATAMIIDGGNSIETVRDFTYMGSVVTEEGDVETDINCRIGKASTVFQRLYKVWKSTNINVATKIKLYMALVVSLLTYASETWKQTEKTMHKLDVFHHRCLRKILKIKWKDHVSNEELLKRAGQREMRDIIRDRRLRFAGHLLRRPQSCPAKIAMSWVPQHGKRRRGRPRMTWRKTLERDMEQMNLGDTSAEDAAQDRSRWRSLVARCSPRAGGTKC